MFKTFVVADYGDRKVELEYEELKILDTLQVTSRALIFKLLWKKGINENFTEKKYHIF